MSTGSTLVLIPVVAHHDSYYSLKPESYKTLGRLHAALGFRGCWAREQRGRQQGESAVLVDGCYAIIGQA